MSGDGFELQVSGKATDWTTHHIHKLANYGLSIAPTTSCRESEMAAPNHVSYAPQKFGPLGPDGPTGGKYARQQKDDASVSRRSSIGRTICIVLLTLILGSGAAWLHWGDETMLEWQQAILASFKPGGGPFSCLTHPLMAYSPLISYHQRYLLCHCADHVASVLRVHFMLRCG